MFAGIKKLKSNLLIPFGVILLLALSLYGCASAPAKVSETPRNTPIVVEATGYAYMGDEDTLKSVRERAREDALMKAIEKGTGIYIKRYAETRFGELREDVIKEALGGLIKAEVIDEGFAKNRYFVKIKAFVYPADVESTITKYTLKEKESERVSAVQKAEPAIPAEGKTGCFCEFPPIYRGRIHTVLMRAPGLRNLRRIPSTPNCICYSFIYSGYMEMLEEYLKKNLPYSDDLIPFRVIREDENSIKLLFDAGFD